jgi:hypothetical protein
VMAVRTRSSHERELKESALKELEAERAKRRELEEQLAQLQQMIAAADGQVPAAVPQTPPQPHGASGDEARERQRRNSVGLARGLPVDPTARRGSLGLERSPEEELDKPWRKAEGDWINSLRQHEPITNLSRPPPAEVSAEQAGLLEVTPPRQRRGSRGGGAGTAQRRRSQSSAAGRGQPSSSRRRLPSADAASAGGVGSAAKWQRMVNLPVEEMMAIRERMGKLERTLNRLHGVDANGWDGTLAQAEERLRAAAQRVIVASEQEGADSAAEQVKAEQQFDAWSKVITSHPAYIRREKTQRKEWDSQNFDKCQSALWLLRPLIPPDISNSSLERVMQHPALRLAVPVPGTDAADESSTVNVPLAERIWRRRVLWLLRATPAEVTNLHSSDLSGPYSAQGLDLMELRAVYAMLPAKFVNDKDGRKAAWREQIRERLVELTEKEAQGILEPEEERHPAYVSSGKGGGTVSVPPLRGGSADDASMVQDGEEDGVVVIAGRRVPFATARFGARRAAFPSAMPTVVASPRRADSDLRNADALRGAVAVVVRGECSFCEKAARVQAAGAVAIVFVNTDEELFSVAPGEDEQELAETILLPLVLVRQSDGAALLAPTASLASRPTAVLRYERPDDSDSSDFDDDTDEEEHRWCDGGEEGTVQQPRVADLLHEVKLAAAKRRPRRTRSPQ